MIRKESKTKNEGGKDTNRKIRGNRRYRYESKRENEDNNTNV